MFNRLLANLWQRITASERAEEQQRKIELITQDAMAKQMVMYKERDLREASARRDRIREAHRTLTRTLLMKVTEGVERSLRLDTR